MMDNRKMDLYRKLSLFGISNLEMMAPIGDLGYANGWYPPYLCVTNRFFDCEMPKMIVQAAMDQGYRFEWRDNSYHRGTDNVYHCKELGLTYHVDSSD